MVNEGNMNPTVDERWPNGVDVALFVDESGTVPHHRILRADRERWVTLAGVEFTKSDSFQKLIPTLTTFKEQWWPPSGEYWYMGPRLLRPELRRIVLHWSDVRNHRGPFSSKALRTSLDQFRQSLRDLLEAMPFRIRAVTLDLAAWRDMIEFSGIDNTWLVDPYHLAFRRLLSEFTQGLQSRKALGCVYVESRNPTSDTALLLDTQAYTISYQGFDRIRYLYFPTKWSERSLNKTSWGALELADICAGILRYQHRISQHTPESRILQQKFATRRGEILIPE